MVLITERIKVEALLVGKEKLSSFMEDTLLDCCLFMLLSPSDVSYFLSSLDQELKL